MMPATVKMKDESKHFLIWEKLIKPVMPPSIFRMVKTHSIKFTRPALWLNNNANIFIIRTGKQVTLTLVRPASDFTTGGATDQISNSTPALPAAYRPHTEVTGTVQVESDPAGDFIANVTIQTNGILIIGDFAASQTLANFRTFTLNYQVA